MDSVRSKKKFVPYSMKDKVRGNLPVTNSDPTKGNQSFMKSPRNFVPEGVNTKAYLKIPYTKKERARMRAENRIPNGRGGKRIVVFSEDENQNDDHLRNEFGETQEEVFARCDRNIMAYLPDFPDMKNFDKELAEMKRKYKAKHEAKYGKIKVNDKKKKKRKLSAYDKLQKKIAEMDALCTPIKLSSSSEDELIAKTRPALIKKKVLKKKSNYASKSTKSEKNISSSLSDDDQFDDVSEFQKKYKAKASKIENTKKKSPSNPDQFYDPLTLSSSSSDELDEEAMRNIPGCSKTKISGKRIKRKKIQESKNKRIKKEEINYKKRYDMRPNSRYDSEGYKKFNEMMNRWCGNDKEDEISRAMQALKYSDDDDEGFQKPHKDDLCSYKSLLGNRILKVVLPRLDSAEFPKSSESCLAKLRF